MPVATYEKVYFSEKESLFAKYVWGGKMKYSKTKKRILSAIFMVSIILAVFITPINAATTVTTIDGMQLKEATIVSSFDDDYFDTVVKSLKAQGIFVGYPDGTMGEYNRVTRAEMATICTRLLEQRLFGFENISDYAPTIRYPDVPNSHWAVKYVSLTNDYGVTQGYPDGTFKPENDVTFNETLKMLLVSGGYGFGNNGDALSYPDGYIQEGKSLGVTDGIAYDGDRAAWRCEIMVMTYQMLQAGQTPQGGDDSYVVKFDLNYNDPVGQISDQAVQKGGYAYRPTTEKVKRANYLLTGWYTDKDCKNEFSFDTIINADIMLYAKWVSFDDNPLSWQDDYEIRDMFRAISKKYFDDGGSIPYKDCDKVTNELCALAQCLYEQGKILKYFCEYDNIEVRLASTGHTFIYEIPFYSTNLGGSGGVDIQTYNIEFDSKDAHPVNFTPEIAQNTAKNLRATGDFSSTDYTNNYYHNNLSLIEEIKKMSGNIIFWHGHGCWYTDYNIPTLSTGIARNETMDSWIDINYKEDFDDDRILKSDKYYIITSRFFDYYLKDNCFEGGLVYLNACHSLQNNYLAEIFARKGASVVIGSNQAIDCEYANRVAKDIMEYLCKINRNYTIDEAIKLSTDKNKYRYEEVRYGDSGHKPSPGITTYYGQKDFSLTWLSSQKIDTPEIDIYVDGIIYYPITEKNVTVLGIYEKRGSYSIPDTIYDVNGRWYDVTEISSGAFKEVTGAKITSLSANIERIGDDALVGMDFSECKLSYGNSYQYRLPLPLKHIGINAFAGAIFPSQTQITLSKGLFVRENAFYEVKNVKTLHIEKEYVALDINKKFLCKDLEDITVDNGNALYKSVDGVLFNGSGGTLFLYPAKREIGSSYTVPSDTGNIEIGAFHYAELKEVIFTSGVYIGDYSFESCNSLQKIVIQSSDTYISEYAIVKKSDQEIEIHGYKDSSAEEFVKKFNGNSNHPKKLVFVPLENITSATGVEGIVYSFDTANHSYSLADVIVTLTNVSTNQVYIDITDDDGNYKIECQEGNYKIRFDKDGYETQEKYNIQVEKYNIEIIDIWITQYTKPEIETGITGIESIVLGTEYNEMLMGVTVTLTNSSTNQVYTGTTDIMGIYKIECIAGTYNIKFEKDGYITQERYNITVNKDNLQDIGNTWLEKDTITETTGTIRVTVYDSNTNTPINGTLKFCSVQIFEQTEQGEMKRLKDGTYIRVDENGMIQWALPEGIYVVAVERRFQTYTGASGYYWVTVHEFVWNVIVTKGSVADVDVYIIGP